MQPSDATVTGTIGLRIRDELVRITLTVSKSSVHPVDVLPAANALTDTIVRASEKHAMKENKLVSCRVGCAACCHQLIAVSAIEARKLAGHVANMPEPRRTVILNRYQSAIDAIRAAGLTEPLLDSTARGGRSLRELALAYLALNIPCPFLENESCSIYAIRPMTCREYLATSPAVNCATPSADTVQLLPLPARVSAALVHISRQPLVLLPFILDWASNTPDTLPHKPGPDILRDLVSRLAGRTPEATTTGQIP